MALEWLKNQGYKGNEIIKQSNTSPDFICQDGKRYEVKFLYANKIIFYDAQVKSLLEDDIILVFDRDKFILKFLWKDREKVLLNVYFVKQKNKTSLQLNIETLERMKKIRLTKRESYNEIIDRLLKMVENNKTR